MKPITERFRFQGPIQPIKPPICAVERKKPTNDAEIRGKRASDQISRTIGEISVRIERAEKRLGFPNANDVLPSLADLDKRLGRVEVKLGFASAGAEAWQAGDPSLDQLNGRLERVEQRLGFVSVNAVGSRGGDSQSAIDQGTRAARLAHERATQISDINKRNAELWTTKPVA